MEDKIKVELKNATMQSFVLCPFILVVLDKTKESGVNAMAVSYVGVVSENPPLVGVAIRPGRYSHQLISRAGEFTLNFPSAELLTDLDFFGTYSGRKFGKIALREIVLEEAEIIKTPRIKLAPLVLECQLRELIILSDLKTSHDFFISEVVACLRKKDFQIEEFQAIVTANYDYRLVGGKKGKAFKLHKER